MALRWRSSFSRNIKEIDNQHKRLIEISWKLKILAPISSKINFEDEVLEIIKELKEYAIYHFDYEEKMMQKYNFEGFEKHRIQHDAFVKRILELEEEHVKFNRAEAVISIKNFVICWITEHILKTDIKYKDFFNNIGIE